MDWPHPVLETFNTIHTGSAEALGLQQVTSGYATLETSASGGSSANLIHYIPFRLWTPQTAKRMFYVVGATANGNVDLGIYDWEKNRLVNTGSTAQGTTNTIADIDITDTFLWPGRYLMAFQFSSGTGTAFRLSAADEGYQAVLAVWQEAAGSFGLPSTATLVNSTQGTIFYPYMGIAFDATL